MATTHAHDPRAITSARGLTEAVRDLTADRVFGIVGAVLVLVSTGLSWYAQRVTRIDVGPFVALLGGLLLFTGGLSASSDAGRAADLR